MVCISSLVQQCMAYECDHSCTPPEVQLLWRLEDLLDRREELAMSGASYYGWSRFTADEMWYALPESFECVADVEKALEMVSQELEEEYGVVLEELDGSQTITYQQISLFDANYVSAMCEALKAA